MFQPDIGLDRMRSRRSLTMTLRAAARYFFFGM
jgi:hypothetical protein